MAAYSGSIHTTYRAFLHDLDHSTSRDGVADVFFRMAHFLNAGGAALIETTPGHPTAASNTRLVAANGPKSFWSDYLALCQTGRDMVIRTLHISPHSLALRDLQHHPRLTKRVASLEHVLARHRLNDLFAVPGLGYDAPRTFALIVGRNFDFRRSKRHLTSRMAIHVLARLNDFKSFDPAASRLDHARLTRRQLEIAHWLVAGKTDWEIGEILAISPKTVNYHVENMKRRYGVHSRSQFIAAIVHEGGIAPHPTVDSHAPHDNGLPS